MAELLIPLNGIGHGHLMRSLLFSDWLRAAGRRPMVVLQGPSRFRAECSVPTTNVPALYSVPAARAQRIADDLAKCAALSSPALVIEDTHLAPVKWPAEIRHVIIVRPTMVEYMRLLNYRRGGGSARILICDHPDSPTWPYDTRETSEILSWRGWTCLGPVFRTGSAVGEKRVRQKYRLDQNDSLFVFSMGGGGEQRRSDDRRKFIATATELALDLRRLVDRPRFLFVRGPLFPDDLQLPDLFEQIREEPELPSLLRAARGAVVRPGFNVTWECIAGLTPFIALPGSTFNEPVEGRLAAMAEHGLQTSADARRLADPQAAQRFSSACAAALLRFDGSPREPFLAATQVLEEPVAPSAHASTIRRAPDWPGLSRLRESIREIRKPVRLLARLDDVTRFDEEVVWLLELCKGLGIFLSLDVIPYHNEVAGNDLDRVDPEGRIEVAQHGYAHLPDFGLGGDRCGEFFDCVNIDAAIEKMKRGKSTLQENFGKRFTGGYSVPFDMMPAWLPPVWQAIGGRYLSTIGNCPGSVHLPVARLSVDPWNWSDGRALDRESLTTRIDSAIWKDEEVGLVFHPQCLKDQEHRISVFSLLESLIGAGCISVRVSSCATGR